MAPALSTRLALLVALLAIAGWWWWSNRMPGADADSAALPEVLIGEPDLFLEGARISQYDEDGVLSYILRSERIRHFETDTLTRLQTPVVTLYSSSAAPDDQQPWEARAKKGFIEQADGPDGEATERVYLTEQVELEQRFDDGRFTRLRTDHLYLYPEQEYAVSEQGVTIDTEVGRTRAAAMYADLTRDQIDLKANENQRVTTIVLRDQFK